MTATQSTQGSGSTNFSSGVTSQLSNYFINPIVNSSVINSNLSSVFDTVNPSLLFTNIANGTTTAPNNGPINGLSGPNFQIQISGITESFSNSAIVPEPASVVMTALGLAGAGLGGIAARRRQGKASA